MRIGSNPEKDNYTINSESYHRIIIPVYIPNAEGYFKDGLRIFKLCVESLLKTIHSKTRITIYNNNCSKDVRAYIDKIYEQSELIDQVFHSEVNMGKINAILAASKGNLEPLITITDSDVFFKDDWQNEVEKKFLEFPEAGMVSPVPSSRTFKNFVDANWYYGFTKGKIRFQDVEDPEGLINFDKSLGRETPLYKPCHLKKYMVLKNRKSEAVMGCGHFVATLRREVFDKGSSDPAFIKIQGGVENKFIDKPNQDLGFLRLATKGNYAYHMGNVFEEWMNEEFTRLQREIQDNPQFDPTEFNHFRRLNKLELFFGRFIKRTLLSKSLRTFYSKRIGLEETEDYFA